MLGGVLGGGHQQPSYQPSGGYGQPGGYNQSGGYNQGSGTSDLLSGLGGALFSSALNGLSKKVSKKLKEQRPTGC